LPPANQLTDVGIAEAASRALELDSLVPADAVKLTMSGGWITLRGEVDWEYELKKSIEDALVRSAKTDAQRIPSPPKATRSSSWDRAILAGTTGRGASGLVGARRDRRGEPDHHPALIVTARPSRSAHR